MPNVATIYLPLNTFVSVQCFTNARFQQRITIAPETGSATVLTGSGEHNAPMVGGNFSITTPGASVSPLGYKVTVSMESSSATGEWSPSNVNQGICAVMYYWLALVVSEDYVDNDWNDGVVQFSWWLPPPSRSMERAAQLRQ